MLTGCNFFSPYTPTIQQGKIIPADIMQKIKPNMSKSQIIYLIGSPDIVDVFSKDKWIYIYTFQPSYGDFRNQQKLIITFAKDKILNVEGTYNPPKEIYGRKNNNVNTL